MTVRLSTKEAAERAEVCEATVRRWIVKGDLPAVRVGLKRWKVDPADLEPFLPRSA